MRFPVYSIGSVFLVRTTLRNQSERLEVADAVDPAYEGTKKEIRRALGILLAQPVHAG